MLSRLERIDTFVPSALINITKREDISDNLNCKNKSNEFILLVFINCKFTFELSISRFTLNICKKIKFKLL